MWKLIFGIGFIITGYLAKNHTTTFLFFTFNPYSSFWHIFVFIGVILLALHFFGKR